MKYIKRLDVFNFFYSIGAVLILIGITAKILDFPNQEYLIAIGLIAEIVIFFISAFSFNKIDDAKIADIEKIQMSHEEKVETKTQSITNTKHESEFLNVGVNLIDEKTVSNTPEFENLKEVKIYPPKNLIKNEDEVNNTWENKIKYEKFNSYLDLVEPENAEILHLEWLLFSDNDYDVFKLVFKKLFNINIPSKSTLAKWEVSCLNKTTLSLNDLEIKNKIFLNESEIKVIYKAYNLIGQDIVLSNKFIFFKENGYYGIRSKTKDEISVFIGNNLLLENYVLNNFDKKFVIAPNIECLSKLTNFKGDLIFEFAISNSILKEIKIVEELTQLIKNQSIEIKVKLWLKLDTIVYNVQTRQGFEMLKILVPFLLSFGNTRIGYQLLNKNLIFKFSNDKLIRLKNILYHQNINPSFYINNMEISRITKTKLEMLKNDDNISEVFQLVMNLYEIGIRPIDGLLEIFGLSDKTNTYDKHLKNISEIIIDSNGKLYTDDLIFIDSN